MPQDNNKIEKTLQSLDGAGRQSAPDFFYTRLQARMEKELLNETKPFFLLRPAFLAACLVMVFAMNVITLVNGKRESVHSSKEAATIESFAKEYNMSAANELYE